ncbi:ATP-binding protein [candidate division KSB1 bacterium]|nr:ATP-binding protein [candidate division KSB1 bacterium]
MSDPVRTENLIIPSRTDELERVDTITERIGSEMGFDDGARADLGICVTEAVNNAIVHAHRNDEALIVEVRFTCYADALKVSIRDHGPGFDVDALPDPTAPENLLKDHGRGVMLIRALMDEVMIHRLADGMLVEMVKKL